MGRRPNPIAVYVGKRVRMRRRTLDMSQTELANGLGIRSQQVQKYEKGTNRISASRLQQISHVLQAPVAFFFEGAPPILDKPAGANEILSAQFFSELLATAEGHALVRAFSRITNPKVRRCLVEIAEAIAEEYVQ